MNTFKTAIVLCLGLALSGCGVFSFGKKVDTPAVATQGLKLTPTLSNVSDNQVRDAARQLDSEKIAQIASNGSDSAKVAASMSIALQNIVADLVHGCPVPK